MRILYGITKSNFGGAQRYVFDLAKQAKKRGFEVAVLLGRPAEEGDKSLLSEKLVKEGIEIFYLEALGRDVSPLADTRSFFKIAGILNDWKPDVFHINSSKMGGVGALAARLLGIPRIIFTSHGWAFNESWRPLGQKLVIKFLHWLTIMLAHETICVSEKTRLDVVGFPFARRKLKVIYNGIEEFPLLSKGEARKRLAPDLDKDALLVGTLAELHKVKGIDILLAAWSRFARGPSARLVVVGEGEERGYLEELAQSLGVAESVRFIGFVENARSVLPGLDIFVLSSRSENLPYAVLEAGIAGLPTIATSVGGVPEIIEPGISGAIVPPDDPDALLSSLILFRDNPRMRDRLGAELRHAVQTKFTKQKMYEETFKTYR